MSVKQQRHSSCQTSTSWRLSTVACTLCVCVYLPSCNLSTTTVWSTIGLLSWLTTFLMVRFLKAYCNYLETFILPALAVWRFFCSDPGILKFDWKGLFEVSWAIVPCLSPRPSAEMEIVYSYILPCFLVTFSNLCNSPSRPVFRARLFQLSSL